MHCGNTVQKHTPHLRNISSGTPTNGFYVRSATHKHLRAAAAAFQPNRDLDGHRGRDPERRQPSTPAGKTTQTCRRKKHKSSPLERERSCAKECLRTEMRARDDGTLFSFGPQFNLTVELLLADSAKRMLTISIKWKVTDLKWSHD